VLRHSLRISRPHLRRRNKRDPDRNQKERKELAPRKMAYQCCIGLTEIFDRDPKNRVEDKEEPSQHSVRLACSRAH